MSFAVALSFPVTAASTSLQSPLLLLPASVKINKSKNKNLKKKKKRKSLRHAHTQIKQWWNAFRLDTKKKKAPDLNLPLQMEGVSTSRQAIEDSGGLLGGQVWSPMEWWGQWRTGGVEERKDPTLSKRQLALRAANSPSSLAVCLPRRRNCACVLSQCQEEGTQSCSC